MARACGMFAALLLGFGLLVQGQPENTTTELGRECTGLCGPPPCPGRALCMSSRDQSVLCSLGVLRTAPQSYWGAPAAAIWLSLIQES